MGSKTKILADSRPRYKPRKDIERRVVILGKVVDAQARQKSAPT